MLRSATAAALAMVILVAGARAGGPPSSIPGTASEMVMATVKSDDEPTVSHGVVAALDARGGLIGIKLVSIREGEPRPYNVAAFDLVTLGSESGASLFEEAGKTFLSAKGALDRNDGGELILRCRINVAYGDRADNFRELKVLVRRDRRWWFLENPDGRKEIHNLMIQVNRSLGVKVGINYITIVD